MNRAYPEMEQGNEYGRATVQPHWRLRLPRRVQTMVTLFALVIVTMAGGVVWASRISSGPILTTLAINGSIPADAVALDTRTNRAFLGPTDTGQIAILDLASGQLLRMVSLRPSGGHVLWTLGAPLAVDNATNHVAVAYQPASSLSSGFHGPGRLAILDAVNGEVRGSMSLPQFSQAGPWLVTTPSGSALFLLTSRSSSGGFTLYGFTRGAPHLIRSIPAGPAGWTSDANPPLALDARDGRLFVDHFGDNRIDVLDARSGRLLRTDKVGMSGLDAGLGSPVVDEQQHRVFVSSSSSGLVATIDARSGRLLRLVRLRGYVGTPVIDSRASRVFVRFDHGLAILNSVSGRLVHTVTVPSNVPMQVIDPQVDEVLTTSSTTTPIVDEAGARLYSRLGSKTEIGLSVAGSTRKVYMLTQAPVDRRTGQVHGLAQLSIFDARTGRLRHRLKLGHGFARVYLTADGQRAVVLCDIGEVTSYDTWAWIPRWLRPRIPFIPQVSAIPPLATTVVMVIDTTRL